MARYLLFRLYGPMCSWGEIAVGESRHTADRPSRSALLGLLGAALGVPRSDDEGQQALSASWRFGLKLLSAGTLLRDYHTVQAPRKERKVVHRTRREELGTATVVNTLLSSREYRLDSISLIAVESTPEARWTLEELQSALRTPRFTLYLGRKSCPLAVPLAPQLIDAPELRTALDAPQLPLAELAHLSRRSRNRATAEDPPTPWPSGTDRYRLRLGAPRLYWEQGMVPLRDTEPGGPLSPSFEFIRHDQPLSRRRWQFAPRREWGHTPESIS